MPRHAKPNFRHAKSSKVVYQSIAIDAWLFCQGIKSITVFTHEFAPNFQLFLKTGIMRCPD